MEFCFEFLFNQHDSNANNFLNILEYLRENYSKTKQIKSSHFQKESPEGVLQKRCSANGFYRTVTKGCLCIFSEYAEDNGLFSDYQ